MGRWRASAPQSSRVGGARDHDNAQGPGDPHLTAIGWGGQAAPLPGEAQSLTGFSLPSQKGLTHFGKTKQIFPEVPGPVSSNGPRARLRSHEPLAGVSAFSATTRQARAPTWGPAGHGRPVPFPALFIPRLENQARLSCETSAQTAVLFPPKKMLVVGSLTAQDWTCIWT